jgi:hypothetical protein
MAMVDTNPIAQSFGVAVNRRIGLFAELSYNSKFPAIGCGEIC